MTDRVATNRVTAIHRVGAVVVAVVVGVIGVLGFLNGLSLFDTGGAPVLGLSTNGALSLVSVVTAVVLVLAALRGGGLASTVMIVVGVLFLISAFVNLWLIGTPYNVLAFRLPNVFFSIGAGLVLLVLGAYGRLSGRPTEDNPYRTSGSVIDGNRIASDQPVVPERSSREELDADIALADAARAEATGVATAEQRRRLAAADEARTPEDRRRIWQSFDEGPETRSGGPGHSAA